MIGKDKLREKYKIKTKQTPFYICLESLSDIKIKDTESIFYYGFIILITFFPFFFYVTLLHLSKFALFILGNIFKVKSSI